MNFYEWLDTLNLELEILRYPNRTPRFVAQIRGARFREYEESVIVGNYWGDGQQPGDAVRAHSQKIQGLYMSVAQGTKTYDKLRVPEFKWVYP